jgi:hypothetical protein
MFCGCRQQVHLHCDIAFNHYGHLIEKKTTVTGISGSKVMIRIGNSGSNPERALCG